MLKLMHVLEVRSCQNWGDIYFPEILEIINFIIFNFFLSLRKAALSRSLAIIFKKCIK